jgi:hypothetical protein
MAEYPRMLSAESAPPELLALIAALTPRLLEGQAPALLILREQYKRARVARVTLTGAGFFAAFDVPADLPRADPPNMIGGDVPMTLEGVKCGAGCLLKVSDGYLDCLEVYAVAGEPWPERPRVLSFGEPLPVQAGPPTPWRHLVSKRGG